MEADPKVEVIEDPEKVIKEGTLEEAAMALEVLEMKVVSFFIGPWLQSRWTYRFTLACAQFR